MVCTVARLLQRRVDRRHHHVATRQELVAAIQPLIDVNIDLDAAQQVHLGELRLQRADLRVLVAQLVLGQAAGDAERLAVIGDRHVLVAARGGGLRPSRARSAQPSVRSGVRCRSPRISDSSTRARQLRHDGRARLRQRPRAARAEPRPGRARRRPPPRCGWRGCTSSSNTPYSLSLSPLRMASSRSLTLCAVEPVKYCRPRQSCRGATTRRSICTSAR